MNPFTHSPFYPAILSSFFHYFIHFSFYPFIHLSLHPSTIFHLSSFFYIHRLFYLSFLLFPFHLFIYPLMFPFFHFPSIIFCSQFLIFICSPIYPSLHLFFHTCFHLFIRLSFVPFINVLPFHFQFIFQQSVSKYRVPPLCLTRNYETTPERGP